MEKVVILKDNVMDGNGNAIAKMVTRLEGDGATPLVQTTGGPAIIGYHDDGTVILSQDNDELIKQAQQEFMATAIKEQKKLCVENSIDPELVNILNVEKKAEKGESDNEQSAKQ